MTIRFFWAKMCNVLDWPVYDLESIRRRVSLAEDKTAAETSES